MTTIVEPIVLVVDDDQLFRRYVRTQGEVLAPTTKLITASNIRSAIDLITKEYPREYFVAFLDYALQSSSETGLSLLRRIMDVASDRVIIYIWSGNLTLEIEEEAIKAGAYAAFSKGESLKRVLLYTTPESQALQRLMASTIEPVTGISNFRNFKELVVRSMVGAWREKALPKNRRRHPDLFNLVVLDMDRFKLINDTHGHPIGTQAIERVAHAIRDHIRESDMVCRYGGDEFVVWLPGPKEAAEVVTSTIEERIRGIKLLDREERRVELFASIGSARISRDEIDNPEGNFEDLFAQADKDMYSRKRERAVVHARKAE